MHIVNSRRTYAILAIVTLITSAGSIGYLTNYAHTSNTPVAQGYPAPITSVAADNPKLAENMALGRGFTFSTTSPYIPDTWRTPGYPAFVLPFYVIFGSFYPVLAAHAVLVFFTVVLLYLMARRFMSDTWALALSVIYLLLPDTMLATSTLAGETLYTFLITGALYLLFFSRYKNTYGAFAATGIIFAITAYIRPSSLYILAFFIPAYLLFYVPWGQITRKHVYGMLLVFVAFAGTLLPWYVRNYEETGIFAFASTGPYFLFRQNAVSFYAGLHDIDNLTARYELEDMAGIPRGVVPTGPEYSAVMQKVALNVIFSHPFKYAEFHLTTFIPFFTSSGANDYWVFVNNMSPAYDRPYEPSLIQALHPFKLSVLATVIKNHGWTLVENTLWALVTLFVLIGLFKSKDVRVARMFFAITLYLAAVTGPGAHARYRMPVDGLLLITAFSAAFVLWQSRATRATSPEPSAERIAS